MIGVQSSHCNTPEADLDKHGMCTGTSGPAGPPSPKVPPVGWAQFVGISRVETFKTENVIGPAITGSTKGQC